MIKQKYDVVVVGGGTTGCCAAIAAARSGVSVLLIEKLPFLGGNMTGGLPWLGFHDKATKEQVVAGVPIEIIERLQKENGATEFVFDPITGSAVGVNGTMLKIVLFQMIIESGIDLLLHTIVTEVEKNDSSISKVTAINRQNKLDIACDYIIDCTESCDIAVVAGGDYVLGRQADGKRQVSSNVQIFGDIDFEEMLEYFEGNINQIRPFKLDEQATYSLLMQMKEAPVFVIGAFANIIRNAKQDGIEYSRDQLIGVAYPQQNELMLVASRVENVDINDAESHTKAEVNGMLQTKGILDLLHKYIPGCANARIVSCGTQLGIRETRHIKGEYLLTAEDLLSAKSFYDSVCKGAYHMDIHSPDHNGLETKQPPVYQIPLRSMLVKGVENIMVAGRGISATHEAMSSTRVAPVSGAIGEACGTACGIAARDNCPLRELDIEKLQDELSKRKVIL